MSLNGGHGGWDQMESHQPSVYGYGYDVNSNSYENLTYPGTFQSMENDSPLPYGGVLQGEVYGYGYGVNSDYHESFPFPYTFQSMEYDSRVLQGEGYGYGYAVNSDYHESFQFPGTSQSMENDSRLPHGGVPQGEVYGYGYGANSDYHESFPFPPNFPSMENDSHVLQGEVYGYGYGANSDCHENSPFPGTSHSMENDSPLPDGVDYPTPPATIDPRLHTLLEFFKEFYMESEELFKKLFPKLEEEILEGRFVIEEQEDSMVRELLEFFKKFPTILPQMNSNQMRVRSLQRSLSLESPRSPSMARQESSLKLQRFKVRTLDLGGKGDTKNGATKNGTQSN